MRVLKLLRQWPLSKVELIEDHGEKILKTVHKDFIKEAYKQKFLGEYCRKVKIPKVIEINKRNNSFIMEYLPTKGEISKEKALELIQDFHKETRDIRSNYFPKYDSERFYHDFDVVRKYLPEYLQRQSKEQVLEFFREVFNSEFSIVHGDFGTDQVLERDGEYYLIDFNKSFYGPSILDIAHLFLRDNEMLVPNSSLIVKSKIICCIMTMRWFELCKEKYIQDDYKREIKEYKEIIERELKRYALSGN